VLVVEEGADRREVEDRDGAPVVGVDGRKDREEGGLGLAPSGGGEDDAIVAVEDSVDGEELDGAEVAEAEGAPDLVLEGRREAIEG
jgi:hypothetical protein